MQHDHEYAKLVARHSDYDELLRMGHVVVRVGDAQEWRRSLKAQARADKIRVRTGTAIADEHVAWAYLKHLDGRRPAYDETDARSRHGDVVREAMGRASLRGHVVRSVIRSEGTKAAGACACCGARLYVDSASNPPLWEGEVFDVDCLPEG
jgi:hypothetical protein